VAVKELMAVETYKKQKKVTEYICLCSATKLASEILTEIIENLSEFSGCANSYNKFVSSRS